MSTLLDAPTQSGNGAPSDRGVMWTVGRTGERAVRQLEGVRAIDRVGAGLQRAVRRLVPRDGALREALGGSWLGHPLHPMLTDVVIGSWTSAWLLDVGGGRRAEASADRLVAVGVVSALPTVASGLSDFADLAGRERRVGVVHAAGNAAALALHVASLRARRRGSRARGVALSTLGCTAAAASGWLGAKLAFSDGIGVSRAAFDSLPARWSPVPGATPAEGEMRRTEIDGVPVLVAMHEGTPVALSDTCSHLGCSLSSGTLAEGRITCPCHGSTFALDGSVLHGPAVSPQPALEARLVDGSVQVRRP